MIYKIYTMADNGAAWQLNSELDTTLDDILAKTWEVPIQIEHTDNDTGVTTIDISQPVPTTDHITGDGL